MHIASLEAQTTLNTYNLWKLSLRDHLNTDALFIVEFTRIVLCISCNIYTFL